MCAIYAIESPPTPSPASFRAPASCCAPEADAEPLGGMLASLNAASHLRERFYSWRGAGGARYVCSVFPACDDVIVAGFSQAAIIGVRREGASRRPICLMSSQQFGSPEGLALRRDGWRLGIHEWHVHFCADAAELLDLANSVLS